MGAIFKKEFKQNITSISGIFFIVLMLVTFGWNFIILTFRAGVPSIEISFSHLLGFDGQRIVAWLRNGFPLVSLIAASALTMRVFTEERHNKSDTLLYSLPVSATSVVLGKYFAVLAMFLLPCIEFAFAPLIAGLYGTINYAQVYAALAAYILLGCALLAISVFVASLFENLVVSVVANIAVILLIYFLPQLATNLSTAATFSFAVIVICALIVGIIFYFSTKNIIVSASVGGVLLIASIVLYIVIPSVYEGLAGKMVSSLGLFNGMGTFADGIIDIGTYIYFASVAVLFIFFTIQSFEKRRWN